MKKIAITEIMTFFSFLFKSQGGAPPPPPPGHAPDITPHLLHREMKLKRQLAGYYSFYWFQNQ